MFNDAPQTSSAHLRAARADDWPDVEPIVATTWEGDDYINRALWDRWAADRDGLLVVAEADGRVAGFAKITRFGPAEWWLEGLRVAGSMRGRGIARALTAYLVDWFEKYGDGMLRLATFSENEASKKLALASGMRHTASYRPISASARPRDYRKFKVLQAHNIDMVHQYLQRSPMYRANRFVENDWKLLYLTHDRLAEYLQAADVDVLAWREEGALHGLAVLFSGPPDERRSYDQGALKVGALYAPDDTTLRAMLRALRGVAALRQRERVVWKMPVGVGLERAIQDTEYQSDWEEGEALLLFERPLRL